MIGFRHMDYTQFQQIYNELEAPGKERLTLFEFHIVLLHCPSMTCSSTGAARWVWLLPLTSASCFRPLTIALLLHQRRMVSLASLDYAELGRCLLGAFSGGAAAWFVAWIVAGLFRLLPRLAELHHARSIADTAILIGGTAVWTAVTMWVLDISGSALPASPFVASGSAKLPPRMALLAAESARPDTSSCRTETQALPVTRKRLCSIQ